MTLKNFILQTGLNSDDGDHDLLRRQIIKDNFSRGRMLASCIIIFDTLLIAADVIVWLVNPDQSFLFDVYLLMYALMVLGALFVLLLTRKPVETSQMTQRWLRRHELITTVMVIFLMTWGSIISLLDQQLYGEVTVFMVNVVICSVVILLSWRRMLLSFALALAILIIGLAFAQPDSNVLLGHYINITIFVIVAWIASRLIYGFYRRDFASRIALTQANQKLNDEILANQDINEKLTHANFQLHQLSLIDELTGIANRRGLRNFISQVFERTDQPARQMSVIIFDIDLFKQYNDRYGHPSGDQVLVRIANVLSSAISSQLEIAARWGGEEFIFLSFDQQDLDVSQLAEKLRRQVESLGIPHAASDVADHVTISVGTSQMTVKAQTDISSVIEAADIAMYKAKEQGRNQVVNDNMPGNRVDAV